MKKRILICANSLVVGGIETSLITLLHLIDQKKYDITLLLEDKTGIYLKDVPKYINIIDYNLKKDGNVIIRKIVNRLKLIKTIIKYNNKFDIAINYTTYTLASSIIVRNVCKNNSLWIHTDYFCQNSNTAKEFFRKIKAHKFKNLVFVSQSALENYKKNMYPNNNLICCRNYIDINKINALAKEKIALKKDEFLFINVSRHDDDSKKLGRIVKASAILKNKGYHFKVLLIGDGPDNLKYKSLTKELDLEDRVIFLGFIKNPYPYYKISDAVILSSDYEGYPVVFSEALALNKPIITTDVSDAKLIIGDKYGIIVEKDEKSIATAMESMLNNKFKFKKFNIDKFNQEVLDKINDILGDNNEI